MSVQKRGAGKDARWVARWRDPAGNEKSRSFPTRLEASRFDAQVRSDIANGRYVDRDAGNITFEEYATQWLAGKHNLRSSTRRLYEKALGTRVYPTIGDRPLNRFTPADLR